MGGGVRLRRTLAVSIRVATGEAIARGKLPAPLTSIPRRTASRPQLTYRDSAGKTLPSNGEKSSHRYW
jgi:hypothetical protein